MTKDDCLKCTQTRLSRSKWPNILTSDHHHSQSPKRTDMVSIDSTHMGIVAVGDLIWQHRLSQPFLFLLSKAENIWLDFSFPRFLASRQWRSQGSGHSLSNQIPRFEFNCTSEYYQFCKSLSSLQENSKQSTKTHKPCRSNTVKDLSITKLVDIAIAILNISWCRFKSFIIKYYQKSKGLVETLIPCVCVCVYGDFF